MKPKDLIINYRNFIERIHVEHDYYAFGLICVGYEFIGKCLGRTLDLDTGTGSNNFNKAIEKFNRAKYPKYVTDYDLYDKLRCGLIHSLSPKPGIWLRNENNLDDGDYHLRERKIAGEMCLVLVIQNFFKEFDAACNEFASLVDDSKIKNLDIDKDYIYTTYPK